MSAILRFTQRNVFLEAAADSPSRQRFSTQNYRLCRVSADNVRRLWTRDGNRSAIRRPILTAFSLWRIVPVPVAVVRFRRAEWL